MALRQGYWAAILATNATCKVKAASGNGATAPLVTATCSGLNSLVLCNARLSCTQSTVAAASCPHSTLLLLDQPGYTVNNCQTRWQLVQSIQLCLSH
jgi:hypothetical protein